jgi:hypothetical protein
MNRNRRGPALTNSTPPPVTLLARMCWLAGRRPKTIRRFGTVVHMPFPSVKLVGGATIWMNMLLLSLSGNAASKDPKADDPGVRAGNAGAGGPLPGISGAYYNLFVAGQAKFRQVDQVVQDGLGPRMNLTSCVGCHAAPATGGSSPKINPQFAFVNGADHGNNTLPSFITKDGPTREARFKKTNPGDMTDGGVHDLFTISGMKGAEGCVLQQPDFAAELARKTSSFEFQRQCLELA